MPLFMLVPTALPPLLISSSGIILLLRQVDALSAD